MLETFNAILKNNSIQWVGDQPVIESDTPVHVHITLLEETKKIETKPNGKKMAEALQKISQNKTFSGINPQQWQDDIRQDRSLPNRDYSHSQ